MGQTASQIENHIEDKREHLSSNLRELENKVKSATDWRYQFKNRPAIFLGLAFGGGMLLSNVIGRPGRRRGRQYDYRLRKAAGAETHNVPKASAIPSPTMDKAYKAWENIKGALIGIAAARVKDYVDQVIPGFSEHYKQAEVEHIPVR